MNEQTRERPIGTMFMPSSKEQILTECLETQVWITDRLNAMDYNEEELQRSIDHVMTCLESLKSSQLALFNLISLLDGRGKTDTTETVQ